jgi:opacity protein-like surface antigen
MRNHLRHIATTALLTAIATVPLPVSGQEVGALPMPAVEVSAGYTFMTDLSDGPEDLNFPAGWYAAAAFNVNRWFGIVGEASGNYKNDFSIGYEDYTFTSDARVHAFMAGPRFFVKSGRVVPYAQILVGVARLHVDTMFAGPYFPPTTHRVISSDTQLALQPGGGVSFLVTERLGIRVGADYRTIIDYTVGDANEYMNELRVLTGFTINWGAR